MFAELVINAILHKDYSRPDYVGVYVYADRMTSVNHNRPLPPVTSEDLNERESFDGRGYVNPELKDMFFALGLIESFGSGVRRAIENLLAPPTHSRCADPLHLENR